MNSETIVEGIIISSEGGKPMAKVHDTALIGKGVKLGHGVIVHALAVLEGNITIGDRTVVGAGVHIFGEVTIGVECRLQSNVFIPGGTIIEDAVFVGPGTVILNDKFPPSAGKNWLPVTLKSGVTIGGGCTILPGVMIDEDAKIGAGSVVTKSIPPRTLAFGNPARPVGVPTAPGKGEWGFYEQDAKIRE